MNLPCLTSIIVQDAIGEYRAAAIDADGRAWRLFSQRWGGDGEVALGQPVCGRVRSRTESQGGTFVELTSGQEAFLASPNDERLTDGALVELEVQSEAYGDKLARVRLRSTPDVEFNAFETWCTNLPGHNTIPVAANADAVEAAFDDALEPSVTLPMGGRLHIESTRALTAIDIDTAGRVGRGSAGARALSINREAAREAARQIALRDLGGAIVLDCVAPINKSSGEQVRAEFLNSFRAVSSRSVQVLTPSKFGLMEVAIARGARPLLDRVATREGVVTPETELLAALRASEREASAAGSDLFNLDLSPDLYAVYQTHKAKCDSDLIDQFGGRVQIRKSIDGKTAVRRR